MEDERIVALFFERSELAIRALDDKSRARFELETKILLEIQHPNFPRMLSFGSCGERPYVVMELLINMAMAFFAGSA